MEAQDTDLTLYYSLVSQPSRAVKTLIDIGKVKHKEVHVDIMKGEHKKEEFVAINPRSLVPFIVEGDFKLGESNAVLKYLCETNESIPEHYWPKDPKKRALTDQFLEWYQYHFRPTVLPPLRAKLNQLFTGEAPAADFIAYY